MEGTELHTTPRTIKRHCGGWLAVSTDNSRFAIGVEGQTEKEALDKWWECLRRWERFLVQPEKENKPRSLSQQVYDVMARKTEKPVTEES